MLKPIRQAVILGLDWGSSSIRASILTRDTRHPENVYNEDSIPAHDEHYQKGAFNAALYLDGIGKVYTGEAIDEDREPVPSKPFFSQSPQTGINAIDALLNGLRADATWALVHEGMEEIAKTVFKSIGGFCNGNNELDELYCIDEIGLSYPAHWRLGERTKYEELLRKVIPKESAWVKPDVDISFHVESLASAHRLFSSPRLIGKIMPPSKTPVLVVFLDFGGYTMKSNANDLSYHRVGETFSAFGGTQLWEQQVGIFCRKYVEAETNRPKLSPRQRAECLEMFHREIKKFETSEIEPMHLTYRIPLKEGHLSYSVCLPKHSAENCFWNALAGPIKLAEKKIAEAVTLSSRVKVVLSGGSGKNTVVQARLRSACERLGVSHPYCMNQKLAKEDSWNISRGAAIATANTISVHESMANGAAFGFQRGGYATLNSPEGLRSSWEEEIEVSLDLNGSRSWKRWCGDTTRIKIICDPFLQLPDRKTHLRFSSCCDVVELPQPSKGYWEFELRFAGDGDDLRLVVERGYMGHTGRKIFRHMPTLELPLYYDPSSCCCLIKTDVDDEGYGLLVTETGEIVACPREPTRNHLERGGRPRLGESGNIRKRKRMAPARRGGVGGRQGKAGVKPTGHLPELKPPNYLPKSTRAPVISQFNGSTDGLPSAHLVRETRSMESSRRENSVIPVVSDTVVGRQALSPECGVTNHSFWEQATVAESGP
ncbi:hypothetical protein CORC01_11132 [Colletotrichum orchidophilum]|uniref:Uncharacterized protein n=1 Tax=Colletotrichum orchidophilum TaxID=1209926 RepID=A0A1G4AWP0_9PEZI|nr:uncharacterized protein CORC01_11132 [Colletotrichum orchidophilum]OHE93535.1 hypothetical protein CORC01_11132 [Colletotrichum orchidophilum]